MIKNKIKYSNTCFDIDTNNKPVNNMKDTIKIITEHENYILKEKIKRIKGSENNLLYLQK